MKDINTFVVSNCESIIIIEGKYRALVIAFVEVKTTKANAVVQRRPKACRLHQCDDCYGVG